MKWEFAVLGRGKQPFSARDGVGLDACFCLSKYFAALPL